MPGFQSALVIGASALLLVLFGWRIWRIFHPRPSPLDHPALFFTLVFAAMLVLRWGMIFSGGELNLDESQMLAQAMRYLSHPVPWRDVDGTTSGPLNSLLLSVPMWCGAPAAWATDRLVLLAINWMVVLFSYLTLRCFLTRAEAQFSLTPLLLFFSFTRSPHFTHYSSETLSSGLISACFYLLASQWVAEKTSRGRMFAFGVLLGAIPFAKLQCVPLAMFLGSGALLLIFTRRREIGKRPRQWPGETAILLAGVIVVPVLILGVVAANGALGDFWNSYIVSSRHYATAKYSLSSSKHAGVPPLVKRIIYVGYILVLPANLGIFFWSGLGALVVLAGICRGKKIPFSGELLWPLATIIVYSGLTSLCFFVAGKPFPHYGTLMISPLALLIGLTFLAGKMLMGWGRVAGANSSSRRWLIGFVVLAIGLQSYLAPLRIYESMTKDSAPPALSIPMWSILARSVSKPGDTLSVWGWMPECYVRMGLPPATRDAVGHYVVSAGPLKQYYRDRHLRDLKRSKPVIFIDAVGDGAFLCWDQWTSADKHESFPELARFIDDNYVLLGSFQMSSKVSVGPLRIYVLKDRLKELRLRAADANAAPIMDSPPGK